MVPPNSRAFILCSHIFVAASAADVLAHEGPAPVTPPLPSSWDHELDRIKHGDVGKDEVEIVLAQYKENLDWSDPFANVRTIYCKGGDACGGDAIKLENIGRESHTFLHHIVSNYDNLAKWTVFSQAEEPTEGYTGRGGIGGHMLTGASFTDYVLHPHRPGLKDPEAFFLMTHSVHLPTLRHAIRSTFKTHADHHAPRVSSVPGMCPEELLGEATVHSSDHWRTFEEQRWLRSFLAEKCRIEEDAVGEATAAFWDIVVQLPRPPADVVQFAQGARFGVSRQRLHQRPKSYYETLLRHFTADDGVDPCIGYMMEWVWWYIAGHPEGAPCGLADGFVPLPSPTSQIAEEEMVFGGMFRRTAGISGSTTTAAPSTSTAAPVPCSTFNSRKCDMEPFSCFWSNGHCWNLGATLPCDTFDSRKCDMEPLSCFWSNGHCWNLGATLPCDTYNERKCLLAPLSCVWSQEQCHPLVTTSTAAPSTSTAAPSTSTGPTSTAAPSTSAASTSAPVPCTTFNNRKCLKEPLACVWEKGNCYNVGLMPTTTDAPGPIELCTDGDGNVITKQRKCDKEPSCTFLDGKCQVSRRLQYSEDPRAELGVPGFLI